MAASLNISKSGWIKKQSHHLKQWNARFTRIEQEEYMCTYRDETCKNRTRKINIKHAKLYYMISEPTKFHIYSQDSNDEFHFECYSVKQATDWLICLKGINEATRRKRTQDNDLDLIADTTAVMSSNALIGPGSVEQLVSDTEVDQLYMKALSLYQLQHYQQCEMITKSVLELEPTHREALKLSKYLMNVRANCAARPSITYNNNYVQRGRSNTVCITDTHSNRQNKLSTISNKPITVKKNTSPPIKPRKKKRHKATLSGVLYDFFQGKIHDIENEEDDEKKEVHPCRLEFKRFIAERIQLSEFYDDLIERFEAAKYDDIRFLKDFDRDLLVGEIGLRPLHVKCFLRKTEIFLNEVTLFEAWLEQIVMEHKRVSKFRNIASDGLTDSFANAGITTFEALYRKVRSKQDLRGVIAVDLKLDNTELNKVYDVIDVIWNSMHHIEKRQLSRMRSVSQSYSEVNPRILQLNQLADVRTGVNDLNAVLEGVDDYLGSNVEGLRTIPPLHRNDSIESGDFDEMFVQPNVDDKCNVAEASKEIDIVHGHIIETPKQELQDADNQAISKGGHEYYDKYNDEVWKRRNPRITSFQTDTY